MTGLRTLLCLICLCWSTDEPTNAQTVRCREVSGAVYKEFMLHNSGDRSWRVTNPLARDPGAKKHLPNPVLEFEVDDLDGAIRAEALLDRWGGHLHTRGPRIRFNGNDWLPIDPPATAHGDRLPENYYFQDNPVIPVPLHHLKAGRNLVEGTCGHAEADGWGQWGLYSLSLRVYFDPAHKPHQKGRILSPLSGSSFRENPIITLDVDPSRVVRADVFAWYEGYDENGDGRFLDWHGGWFQPNRNLPAEWQGHVGTVKGKPFQLVWNTRWVPDQPPGQIRLVARIQDTAGVWFVTDQVEGLSLQRPNETVKLYRVPDFPPEFGVRVGQRKSCALRLPNDFDPKTVVEVGLQYRTWHGWDKHHAPYQINQYQHPLEGHNHHYHFHIHVIPPEILRAGDNLFTIFSPTEHHMLEILWPGPALIVREKRTAPAR